MDVGQRDEEISRFFTFLLCLLAKIAFRRVATSRSSSTMQRRRSETLIPMLGLCYPKQPDGENR
jgi:hypothetical protein